MSIVRTEDIVVHHGGIVKCRGCCRYCRTFSHISDVAIAAEDIFVAIILVVGHTYYISLVGYNLFRLGKTSGSQLAKPERLAAFRILLICLKRHTFSILRVRYRSGSKWQ